MLERSQRFYEFGPFLLDAAERVLLREGEVVSLRPMDLDLLVVLVRQHGHILEKRVLMDALWPDSFVEEANLSHHIFTLRRVLGEEPGKPLYIETVPKRGYRFVASVKEVREEADSLIVDGQPRSGSDIDQGRELDGEARAVEIRSPSMLRALMSRRWIRAGAAIAVTALVGTAAMYLRSTRAPALTERDSVLLLDFTNKTGEIAFDGVLKQALAAQLEQSPYLNVFPDERVRETLKLMERSPDTPLTPQVAREICERQGLKATLGGTIVRLDRHYVITLEAINVQTNEVIAREVIEPEGKDQVLKTLGGAAAKLRHKLGESLVSIRRFDAPIEEATTSSLEALKAFSLGVEKQLGGQNEDAKRYYLRAIELDANFATAYARLSGVYNNLEDQEGATRAAQRAFELRERVTEREKFLISASYFRNVSLEFDKEVALLELWKRTYPRDPAPAIMLGVRYDLTGQEERSIAEYREALQRDPRSSVIVMGNLGFVLMRLNRFGEANDAWDWELSHNGVKRIGPGFGRYQIAFAEGDAAAMKQVIDRMTERHLEHWALFSQAKAAAFSGRLGEARELSRRAVALTAERGFADSLISGNAAWAAAMGHCHGARESLSRVSTLSATPITFLKIGVAGALCADPRQTQSMIGERVRKYTSDTVVNKIYVPLIEAAIDIRSGHRGQAIEKLQSASRYKSATYFLQSYLLGLAYLGEGMRTEAAAEFQEILEHRGWDPTSPLYPLAHLGLARAAVLSGDAARGRKEYQDFFALWKDADTGLPILNEAKKEYARLR